MQEGFGIGHRDGQVDIVLHKADKLDEGLQCDTGDGVRWRETVDEEECRGGSKEE